MSELILLSPEELDKSTRGFDGVNLDATRLHPDDPAFRMRKLDGKYDLSKIEAITFDSSGLGRDRRGPVHVTGFVTETQTLTVHEDGERQYEKPVDCSYFIVRAPLNTLEGEEASLEKTVDHLAEAQEAIDGMDWPVDYTGEVVIENREDSVLETPDDLKRLESFVSYNPLYSINVDEPHGFDLLQHAPMNRVKNIKCSERTTEIEEYVESSETVLTEINRTLD